MCLAVPGRIVGIRGEDPLWRTARVDFGGVFKEVSLACVPDAEAGQYVIVHAGGASGKLDEEEAARLLEALRSIGEAAATEGGTA
ncbi:MAG: HypC/HybG/HupF family hydrogenase formation chaperone [Verrucomicrobiales bacterium]|nr:HypC/HybG/HupF family hydrogenase formation chaperone [Verrucomicrobiales bacterium]